MENVFCDRQRVQFELSGCSHFLNSQFTTRESCLRHDHELTEVAKLTHGGWRGVPTCVTLYIKGVVGATPDLQSATPRCLSATPSQNHC